MTAADPPDVSEAADRPAGADHPESVDLDRIAADLAGVERAMERIEAGTYWTDEATGEPLPDELLATDPTARRGAGPAGGSSPAPPPP